MPRFRRLKPVIMDVLRLDTEDEALQRLAEYDAGQIVGPLFAMLLAPDDDVRWRAVTGLGATVARMAEEHMEDARVVMRRFMWHMNEESGNVGWGIPESMGEAMARHERLADEYYKKLSSYVQCPDCTVGDDNFLDHPPLRIGVYWGLARLAEVRPELAGFAEGDLVRSLASEDGPLAQALIARTCGLAGVQGAAAQLEVLTASDAPVEMYAAWYRKATTLGTVAREALSALSNDKE